MEREGGAGFHLYNPNCTGARFPASSFFSVHVRGVDGSFRFPPTPQQQKNNPGHCLCASSSLCRRFVAVYSRAGLFSLCLFLLRLSLLVTPPCVPTPHPSVSQELRSPAEEPSCGHPTPAAGGRARRWGGRAEGPGRRRCTTAPSKCSRAILIATPTSLQPGTYYHVASS